MANGDPTADDPHERRFAEIEQRVGEQERIVRRVMEVLHDTSHDTWKRLHRELGYKLSDATSQRQRHDG